MKKIYLLILVLTTLAGCSSDDLTDTSPDGGITTRNAIDKIFTVKQIASNVYETAYTNNYMCTDADGDVYFIEQPDYNTVLLKKYDSQTNEVSTHIVVPTSPNWHSDLHAICIDNQKNIYYTNGHQLLKILANNGGIVDLTARLLAQSEYYMIYGLCAADNGNVFLTLDDSYSVAKTGEWKQQQKLLKIAANGKFSEVINNIEAENFYFKGGGIVKPIGAFVYAVQGFGSTREYVKASTTSDAYESFTTRTTVQSITAALSKANPYALSGFDIIQLRPGTASDLLIGTIPNYLSDGQGGFLELEKPTYFCSNSDATVFYVVARIKGNDYKTKLFKVTFD